VHDIFLMSTQQLQLALYQLGYTSRSLSLIAEAQWFAARPHSSFPDVRANIVGEIEMNSARAVALLDESPATEEIVQQLAAAAESAWEDLRENWGGEDHQEIIRVLAERAEEEILSDEWWSRSTPLEYAKFREFRQAYEKLVLLGFEWESLQSQGNSGFLRHGEDVRWRLVQFDLAKGNAATTRSVGA
jgi:hypothetical protein